MNFMSTVGKNLYAFRSRRISMVGVGIQDGDIIIFDGSKEQSLIDDVYVFALEGNAYCKLLRFDTLKKEVSIFSVQKQDLRDVELVRIITEEQDGFQIFGRVLCWIHENRVMWK